VIKPKQSQTVHIEILGDELSVYDWQHLQMHSLNPTAARVFEMCDGQTSPEQIATRLDTPHAEIVVWQSLDELGKANLLQEPLVSPRGMSRRDFIKVGSAVALASIVSIIVPRPALARSAKNRRTADLGIIPADSYIYYFHFIEGPITADDLADTSYIIYRWNGSSAPFTGVYSRLASGLSVYGSPWAGGRVLIFRASPYEVRDYRTWQENRPYRGISFQNTTGIDWEAGRLVVLMK